MAVDEALVRRLIGDQFPERRARVAAAVRRGLGQRGLAGRRALGVPLPAARRSRSRASSARSPSCPPSPPRLPVAIPAPVVHRPAGPRLSVAVLRSGAAAGHRGRRRRARRRGPHPPGAGAGPLPAGAARHRGRATSCRLTRTGAATCRAACPGRGSGSPSSGTSGRRRRSSTSCSSRPWRCRPSVIRVVLHGDLHFRHLLVDEDGALTGVIDWGDLCCGDPSIDISLLWSFFPPEGRSCLPRGLRPRERRSAAARAGDHVVGLHGARALRASRGHGRREARGTRRAGADRCLS